MGFSLPHTPSGSCYPLFDLGRPLGRLFLREPEELLSSRCRHPVFFMGAGTFPLLTDTSEPD